MGQVIPVDFRARRRTRPGVPDPAAELTGQAAELARLSARLSADTRRLAAGLAELDAPGCRLRLPGRPRRPAETER
jgi:hypothetical protein